jgi:AraC-like DNA-binding protein
MLCYLSSLDRNYKTLPDLPVKRVNWEFYAILRGKAGRKFPKGGPTEYRSNYLWLVKPGQCYQWVSKPNSIRRVVFHFTHVPEILRKRLDQVDCIGRSLNANDRHHVVKLANDLMIHYLNPTELLDIAAQKVLCELTLLLLKDDKHSHLDQLKRKEHQLVRRAEDWYQTNMNKRPTIDHVAAECGLSSSQLRRYFKKVYNAPPQLIFRRLRLYEAARLLINTDWTIDRIYPEAGFNNRVDFHRTFKEEYGASPLKWRKRD